MKTFRKIISIVMIAAVLASVIVAGTVSSGATGTGIGLAEWAFKAYNEGWSYSWGGATPGAVDCSGLIYSYCGGNRTSMLADAQANGRDWGYVSNGIPNIHGLGLSRTGHVGVYVGGGMEIDARGSGYGICYQAIGGYNNWTCWFKLSAVSYPTTGWQQFCGNYYYYENGEYITNTSRTFDGVTYYFSASGVSSTSPDANYSAASSSDNSSSASSASGSASTATTAPADDNGSLKKGSQGARVEKLQTRLQELGYYHGIVDGDFGDLTEKAFKLFQKQAGLYVDGIAGSDADYLYSDSAPRYVEETQPAAQPTEAVREKNDLASTAANEPEEEAQEETAEPEEEETAEVYYTAGDFDDEIVTIQERLIKLGYLDGTADGSYGELTEEAVKAFQTANKLEETGSVDQKTYDMIFSNAAVKSPLRQSEEPEQQAAEEEPTVSPIAATTAGTEVEKANTRMAAKAVASVTDSIGARAGVNANMEFILWLAIMIVVMLFAFIIVYSVEKKKARAMAQAGRRFM